MNSPRVCRPAWRDFVQLLDAALNEFEVGRTGRKARMGAGVKAFHFTSELGQLAQQFGLGLARGAANLLGHCRQVTFGVLQGGGNMARHRQAEQRHHAVGLDLEQALHGAAEPARVHALHAQQLARKAVGVQAEVGVDTALPFADGRADQAGLVEQRAGPGFARLVVEQGTVGDLHVQTHQPFAGQRAQPFGADLRERRIVQALRARRRCAPEGVGLEFGVLLPAQPHAAQVNAQVAGVRCRQRQVARLKQAVQVLARRRRIGREKRQMRKRQGRGQLFVRTGVNLVVQRFA